MCRFRRICLDKEALTLAVLELGFFPPFSLQKESAVLSLWKHRCQEHPIHNRTVKVAFTLPSPTTIGNVCKDNTVQN